MEKPELYENKNDYLRNVIRGYTAHISNKIEKHFSRVFDEPITSAKVHSIVQERKAGILTMENQKYVDKLLEIMEVERGDNLFERAKPHTDVRERYIEFTQGIRPETSSSSVKSADRVSPKRKPAKVSPVSATRKASKFEKKQEKEAKALEKQRIKEEKERIKTEKEAAKTLAKEEKATKAKTKTIVSEKEP
jgi:hypothetical protein